MDEYVIDLLTECSNEKERDVVEDQLMDFLKKMGVKSSGITNQSKEATLDLTWTSTKRFPEKLKAQLIELATEFNLCFELQDSGSEDISGPIFIGVEAIRNETMYFLEELRENASRLVRRTEKLSQILGVPEEEIQRALSLFLRK